MNLDGWVPLWRKSLTNDVRRHDKNAWYVFETVLMLTNWETGIWEGGRFQLASACEMNPNTVYACLKRLEKAKMITLSSNTKFSTVSICKMKEYKVAGNTKRQQRDNNQITTKQQPDNTLIRNKEIKKLRNKEVNTKVLTVTEVDKRDPSIKQVIEHWETSIGPLPRMPQQIMAASELLKQHAFRKTIGAINAVADSRGQPFAPNIGSLDELRDKWVKLENFYATANSKPKGVKIR